MQIYIKSSLSQKTIAVEVEKTDSIETVKQKFILEFYTVEGTSPKLEGTSPKSQQLFLNEKPLDELKTVADYEIQKDTTLLLRMRSTANKCKVDSCPRKAALIIGDCKFCKKNYCAHHRLPETHSCSNIQDCRQQSFDKNKEKLQKEKCVGVKV